MSGAVEVLEPSERATLPPPHVPGAHLFAAALAAIRRCPGHEADLAERLLFDALAVRNEAGVVAALICAKCTGTGTIALHPHMACRECGGRGTVRR